MSRNCNDKWFSNIAGNVFWQHLMMLVFITPFLLAGCSFRKFMVREQCVLDPDISKEALVQHVNRNILGTESSPGISGWRTVDAKVKVSKIPISLPASIAVEAPRNLRIIVSTPGTRSQEVDLGSNNERFWVWSKDSSEVVTCKHEDTHAALQQFNMPIPIQPEWLAEVFGVVPINGDEFHLEDPNDSKEKNPVLDLVAHRVSPSGERVERVVRVNTCTGRVQEHILRKPDGEYIASAYLDHYEQLPSGVSLPTYVQINWYEEDLEMRIALGHVEANPPSFASANALWQMPNIPRTQVVDIGEMSRRLGQRQPIRMAENTDDPAAQIRQLRHDGGDKPSPFPGKVTLESSVQLQAPVPFFEDEESSKSQPSKLNSTDDDVPAWARERSTQKPMTTSATWQPSTYSPATWQSSSDPPPLEQE